ncbi:hypothetical protein E2562_013163 [Oryza meyeriana var. granulata]|uniref:Uncharacterized protein n=1 Tax=Oryza meyeriana var. granulata TaxID=110450 RepID=A0A6G1DHY1_9ORYZ|nr:hypothetical protein E2562_013163 [Oryza meyeriana var. granulata]
MEAAPQRIDQRRCLDGDGDGRPAPVIDATATIVSRSTVPRRRHQLELGVWTPRWEQRNRYPSHVQHSTHPSHVQPSNFH